MLSVLDIFRIGIGPSSSHTVGPMRIARRFVRALAKRGLVERTGRVAVELQGSLALTGIGHGTVGATILGLAGFAPDTADPDEAAAALANIRASGRLVLAGHDIAFDPARDIDLAGHIIPALHPNGMVLRAFDAGGGLLLERTYYSTGGGFVASEAQLLRPSENDRIRGGCDVPHDFGSAEELLAMCGEAGLGIAELVLANEDAMRPRDETEAGLDRIAEAMDACIERGLYQEGILPGGLQVHRRAPGLWRGLQANPQSNEREQLFDWLNCYAMAVNEENAAGGRVVTAPTNGAAGIVPAVMRFYCEEAGPDGQGACTDKRRRFLLTAGAIGLLYKQRASISGAEMGCQGEVGVACSMAAGGLAAVWGASPAQVACAAEIGMEHNLGLTCDPVGGLVQVPCIERNAIGAVKAVNAARLALHRSEANTCVSLDQVIETMRQTGLDMSSKYKETSQGGLAVNVIEC
jgi:L-serine dehydratase